MIMVSLENLGRSPPGRETHSHCVGHEGPTNFFTPSSSRLCFVRLVKNLAALHRQRNTSAWCWPRQPIHLVLLKLWGKSLFEVTECVMRSPKDTRSWSGSESERRVMVCVATAHSCCVFYQPYKNEVYLLPSELDEASQRTHREHSPNEVVGKVPVRSCRESHQKTADHQFVDKQ